ncbi:MAG TPA: helix-turn-helix transcriptional regulator [Gaiellaceae bacterium]|nr:helix-turn-helix transcriptional regulator [Gaiellaceae bacterium]
MNQSPANRLGEWLRERRREAGIGTTELAKRTGINDATITRIEQGAIASPDPHKLRLISQELDLNLADVYAMAGYAAPTDLPSFQPYLRRKYGGLSDEAIEDLEQAFERIIKKHGYEPTGPSRGEDEEPIN